MINWTEKSQCGIIEKVLNIDEQGFSDWCDSDTLNQRSGFIVCGDNGSALINRNRGIGTKYLLEKKRAGKNKTTIFETPDGPVLNGKILAVRTVGFVNPSTYGFISYSISKIIRKRPCARCNRTPVQVDHRDARKAYSLELPLEDFQALCSSCNSTKREFCKKCKRDNIRFNAKEIYNYPIAFLEGNEKVDEELSCIGCYWYGPKEFNEVLIPDPNKVREILNRFHRTVKERLPLFD